MVDADEHVGLVSLFEGESLDRARGDFPVGIRPFFYDIGRDITKTHKDTRNAFFRGDGPGFGVRLVVVAAAEDERQQQKQGEVFFHRGRKFP